MIKLCIENDLMTCHFSQALSPFVSQHSNPNQAAPAVFSAAPLHHAATATPTPPQIPKSPNHPCSTARPRRCRHGHAGNSRRSHLGFPFPLAPPLLRAHARPVQCCSLHLRTCRQRSRKQAPHQHHPLPNHRSEVTPQPALLLVLG